MGKHVITATVYDKRGRVLSTAQNSYVKTHPLMADAARKVGQPERIYLHAEVAALVRCDWSKAHSMFISRYDKSGNPQTAAPCKCCQHVLLRAGVKNVFHT